jgi:hypothetical protein
MKTKHQWKSASRLDSILNVLLIVLALGVLGVGAMESEAGSPHATASAGQHT